MNKDSIVKFLVGAKATQSQRRRTKLTRFVLGSQESDPKAEWAALIVLAVIVGAITAVIKGVFPASIPYGFFELWTTKGEVMDWLKTSLPIFGWAVGVTAFVSVITRNKPEENRYAEEYLQRGFFVSVRAGLMEEVIFRWLLFMLMIPFVKVMNFILLGFAGFGLVELLHVHIMGPIANFFTLKLLAAQLVNPSIWFVGAGLLAANSRFRDGHKYLGFIGFVNSWFIGMFMFYLMFKFGLLAAILVHFLYDLFIFVVRYIDCVIERRRGGA